MARKSPKPTPAPADEATITEELRAAQNAVLLLQLLNAENHTLAKGPANKFRELTDLNKVKLGLAKAATANYRRERLKELGYLEITPGRGTVNYTLLPNGIEYLASFSAYIGDVEINKLKGTTINALITAARENSFQREPVQPEPVPELADLILAEFDELRRERHSQAGLVPIHEIRSRIAARIGPAAARHDVLDEAILALWRANRIGLEPISDFSTATEEQLNDSIPGEGNTLFYLEVPREQAVIA